MWDDENYYLLDWDANVGILKHFRVDKMTEICMTDWERQGHEAFSHMDMSTYSQTVFGMFSGTTETVRLRFTNRLAGPVLDRFGKDTLLIPDGRDHFTVTLTLAVSPLFYAWVFGFGSDAEILAPQSVRQKMGQMAAEIAKQYQ